MNRVYVSGYDQDNIELAKEQAGEYGTVVFPPGEWLVDDLTFSVIGQTWELTPASIIKRAGAGNLLLCTVPGKINGGVWDGSRDLGLMGNPNASGICGLVDFVLKDMTIQNVLHWGSFFMDGKLQYSRLKTKNTGFAGILWQSEAFRSQGPLVEDCEIDRTQGYTASGGIIIMRLGATTNFVVSPTVRDCKVTMPQIPSVAEAQVKYQDAVCIELRGTSGGKISGCTTTYGKIGLSFVGTSGGNMIGNLAAAQFYYGLELAGGSNANVLSANAVTYANAVPSMSRGVSCSDASNGNRIADTIFLGCSTNVGMNADSNTNVVA